VPWVLFEGVKKAARAAQVGVVPSTSGVDPDIRGIKKNTEPSGALRRTAVHHGLELVWAEVPVSSELKID